MDRTTLMCAVRNGHLDVVQFLFPRHAHPNAADQNGWTALMFVAENGQLDVVQFLLDQGADPNAADQNGRTALMFAAENGHTLTVRWLAFNSTSVFMVNVYGQNALHWAFTAHEMGVALFLAVNYPKLCKVKDRVCLTPSLYANPEFREEFSASRDREIETRITTAIIKTHLKVRFLPHQMWKYVLFLAGLPWKGKIIAQTSSAASLEEKSTAAPPPAHVAAAAARALAAEQAGEEDMDVVAVSGEAELPRAPAPVNNAEDVDAVPLSHAETKRSREDDDHDGEPPRQIARVGN